MVKSQSAMEYLMTYGWAILIIAVVLGAIYSLGLFNGAALAPRTQPGSCQVIRPNGALTTQYISLAGDCTDQLPEYVAQFNGGGYVNVGSASIINSFNQLTITMWVNIASPTLATWCTISNENYNTNGYEINIITSGPGKVNFQARVPTANNNAGSTPTPISGQINFQQGQWYFASFTYNGVNQNMCINNGNCGGWAATGATLPSTFSTYLADNVGGTHCGTGIIGQMADVQIYNTSLDSSSINSIYYGGIGAPPVNLQNLVAWYPLNGNANDYSGNLNNGAPVAVTYTNQWLSGYTVP